MKKIVKIILITIPILAIIIVLLITSMKKKTSSLTEDLLKIACNSGTHYDETIKDKRDNPIKKDSILECTLSIHSPKKTKLTYNRISFDYIIEGDYEYDEKPKMTSDLLIYNDKDVSIILSKEHTINKKEEYDTIYAKLYSFKLHIPNNDNISDKITFKLSNIKIENNKNIYLLKDYTISYDIKKWYIQTIYHFLIFKIYDINQLPFLILWHYLKLLVPYNHFQVVI